MQAAHSLPSQLTLPAEPLQQWNTWDPVTAEPPSPSWRPAVLMGTAATVTTAVLSLNAPAPQQAVQPLPAAQPLTASSQAEGGNCSATCRDLAYIQTQMDTVRQHMAQRHVALQALQAQSGVAQPQATAQVIARHVERAQMQQEQLEQEANQLRRQLYQINQQLGLEPETSAAELLNRMPEYHALLQQWQQADRQLAEVSNATILNGPVWDPREHDFPTPAAASKQALLAEHQQISSQLQGEMESIYLRPVQVLIPELATTIAEDPLRLAHVKSWLAATHRLQITERRQQTLEYLAERLEQQQQIWQRLAQRQEFLEADLVRAQETLDNYTSQAQRLQNLLHAEQQVISSPDLISSN
ncbi:MAG: hypothetical protein ACFB5Z_06645 [Elainellaceae cyanobacterium]